MSEDQTTDPLPDPAAETWAYGGVRLDSTGKPIDVWVDDAGAGEELWFAPKKGFVVGSLYTTQVIRRDGDRISRVGTPTYAGRLKDDELRARLTAEHQASMSILERKRQENRDRTDDALDKALEPLINIAKTMRNRDQRDAFLVTVMRRLSRTW